MIHLPVFAINENAASNCVFICQKSEYEVLGFLKNDFHLKVNTKENE
jgi:hypothetical protein